MNNESKPFLSNLAEIHDAESRIAKALSKMNKSSASVELKKEIVSHLKDTESTITGFENIHHHFCGRASDAGPPTNGPQCGWKSACYACSQECDGLVDRIEAANFLEAILEDESNPSSSCEVWA